MSNKQRLGSDPFAESKSGGLDALLSPTITPDVEIPDSEPKTAPRASQTVRSHEIKAPAPVPRETTVESNKAGLAAGYTRATLIVNDDYLKALKDKAYYDRKKLKEVVNEAFAQYLERSK